MATSPTKTKPTAAPKTLKFKIPKTIGACADRLYELKAQMAEAMKAVNALDAERKAVQEYVINELPKSDARGVSGKVANVRVITAEVPQVQDWDKFYEYVRKTRRTDLLQRRLSDAAIGELWDQGKQVPGVIAFKAVKISLTKAG